MKTIYKSWLYCLILLGSYTIQAQNIALNKPTLASAAEGAFIATSAVDGNAQTRWASAYETPSWIRIDLGQTYSINQVVLNWERACAESYLIMVSNTASTPNPNSPDWTTISTKTGMPDQARLDNLQNLSGTGRYIAMYGTNKLHPWGYSLWEFEVYAGAVNQAPSAYAGADQNLGAGATTATLAGSGTDPDGNPLTYKWTQTAGPTANINNSTLVSTNVTGLSSGYSYTFQLIVNDGTVNSSPDQVVINVASASGCGTTNIALNKPAATSSYEADYIASQAFDNNINSRWSSNFTDNEWIRVDLQTTYSVCQVTLIWEGAYGKNYEIRLGVTNDINASTVIATVTNGDGGQDIVTTDATKSGQYLWMKGLTRGTGYGYSLWEIIVNGSQGVTNHIPVANAGADQNLSSTSTTTTLSGSATDADNDPLTYLWSKISGPNATIANPNAASTSISGLVAGSNYVFQLIANDGKANSIADQISVNVAALIGCGPTNVALNKPAVASSVEGANTANVAFDGNGGTRWGSAFTDNEWLRVDLGSAQNVCEVTIQWEGAYGKNYEIRVGNTTDINASTVIAIVTNGDGGQDVISTNSSIGGRYLWMKGLLRGTGWGYSIWEMSVKAGQGNNNGDTQAPTNPGNLSAVPAAFAVTVNWSPATDNVGVVSYKIYEGASLKATVAGASNSMTISGLDPQTQHTYTVKAVDAVGNESSGANVTFTTLSNNSGDGKIGIGNIAVSIPANASSVVEGSANRPENAVDGNNSSRWESAFTDNEWITVDLGLKYQIGRVILKWEAASGRHYLIQSSDDNQTWNTLYEFDEPEFPIEPRTDDLLVSGAGQYVRMQGIQRNTPWSYSLFEFEVYSPGSGPDDIPNPDPNPNPAPVPPGPSTFAVISPNNGAMITNTRFPTLTWQTSPGATSYEVWVNITKTDYDWNQMGNLLDRFTKVGEVAGTSFTFTQPLVDRWTYKWYIVAKGSATTYSQVGLFSVYLPIVEQQNDGINLINGMRDMNKNGAIEPYEDWHNPIQTRINDLMSRMTIEEKAYQMFYNAQSFPQSGWAFGPGTINDMFNRQAASAGTRLGIPFVSAGDCIHGYSTSFPTQSALAASRNLENTRQCFDMQRVEQKAVGFRGTLAPLAEVGTKVLYPRIQEGNGEDADLAAAMVRAMVCGLQGGPELNPSSVLVTTKHWPGEGAGGEALIVYDGVTIKYHMKPWFANVDANAGSIMPGYAGSSYLDPGGPGAGDSKKILDYLRDVVKFDGVICTDWLPWGAWSNAANAGSDVMGGADPGAVGFSMATFINEVGEARINEAVQRILTVKFKLGVFEDPYGDPVNGSNTWFTPEHQAIAKKAAIEAMTLIKNDGTMPLNLPAGSNLLVTGARANDGSSYSVWTSYFHDEYGAKTMFESMQAKGASKGINVYLDSAPNPAAAVIILGEPSYTHGTAWDKEKPYVHDAFYPVSGKYEYDLTNLNSVKAMGIPYIVVVIMPRPYVLTDLVNDANAVLIAYRPGDGGGPALADILFGDYAPKGKLPWQLPRSMDQVGLDNLSDAKERWDLPYDLGATASEIQEIRAKIATGEHIEPIYGNPLFQYGFGLENYSSSARLVEEDESETIKEAEEDKLTDIQLYPNPTSNRLNIRLPDQQSFGRWTVLTMTGHVLMRGKSDTPLFTIDTSVFDSGIYVIKVEHSDIKIDSKIFIKN